MQIWNSLNFKFYLLKERVGTVKVFFFSSTPKFTDIYISERNSVLSKQYAKLVRKVLIIGSA